ncbi:MAG: alpha-ketoacid dehydrogenase subunit beta [Candidatus Dormibacteraeota bacterium]|jgi:pyruvate dehydrogenase E1 component beta subunit|nr:alpha-ketoacid dehydrogenase subunit beta [Candidatus Dormibacteraeota bacterium]
MAEMTYRDAVRGALREEMARDQRVILMGESITGYGGSYAVTKGLIEEFGPRRVMETPIAEAGIVGFAVGAAMGGLIPVAELMTVNFALLALDQIVNSAAKFHYMFGGQFSVPMVVRTVSGFGQLGPTHSQTFEGWFASVPGLKVVMPATPADAKGLLLAAMRDPDPVIFIEHSLLYSTRGEVADHEVGADEVPIGKARVAREGSDVTVLAYSRMLLQAMHAAEVLEREDGISCEVVDLRTLRPLDYPTMVRSVQRTHRLVVCGEDWRTGGFGASLLGEMQDRCFDDLDAPIQRVAMRDVPLPYSRELEKLLIPSSAQIVDAVRRLN